MNIKQDCQNSKLTLIALHKIVQETAAGMGLDLNGSLSTICENATVNRTQVYERKGHLEDALERTELDGPGRPPNDPRDFRRGTDALKAQGWEVMEKVLRYRLAHPGALVTHEGGHSTYSGGFIRFILDLLDEWEGSFEAFNAYVGVPYQTLRYWCKKDKEQPYREFQNREIPSMPAGASEDFRRIASDYAAWQGSIRDFFKHETLHMQMGPTPIRRVLLICGMLPVNTEKGPRYRGSTTQCQPGNVLVTDGKEVDVIFTGTGEVRSYNWQAMVEQTTACHTAVVVSDTECAESVLGAFDESCEFLGRAPQGLVHDNKPIHLEQELRAHIEQTTTMIPATLNRPENKAVVEGEFGKYEQEVGTIYLNDSSEEDLKTSAVQEALRAYTSGINHAGRVEFDGKSRERVVREACPDPDKDREFIEQLQSEHTRTQRVDKLPTYRVSRSLLDEGFQRFGIETLDPEGKTRQWLAGSYTPEAIRQGLAIFGTEQSKGRIQNSTAHRYLVKVIQNSQQKIDLRHQEELLREFAQRERTTWLQELESEHKRLLNDCDGSSTEKDLAFRLSDNAVFGGLALQRAFWENKLKTLLENNRDRCSAVCNHVRRLFEATWENRFALISKLLGWQHQLAA